MCMSKYKEALLGLDNVFSAYYMNNATSILAGGIYTYYPVFLDLPRLRSKAWGGMAKTEEKQQSNA